MEYIKSDAVLSTYTVREYIDDGISGTRFDREAFEEMMTQVKEGNIQVIITKDYSRLGRDYLEVGRYLEFVFPVLESRNIHMKLQQTVAAEKNMKRCRSFLVHIRNIF